MLIEKPTQFCNVRAVPTKSLGQTDEEMAEK